MSAIHPAQSLQSFQLSKLLRIEWLEKIFKASTEGLHVDD